jgi:hypothetical protein
MRPRAMRKYIEILLVLFIIGLTSCDRYEEVKEVDIKKAFILNSSITFKGYYYQGSDNSYHYFLGKWDLQKDKYFKLPLDRLAIEGKYKVGLGDKELRIDLFGQDNDLFGQNEFYKLYVIRKVN